MQGNSVKDTIARLTQLSKKRKFSDEEKVEIASLYPQVTQFLFFERKGCNDCYKDACIEMVAYLRKNGKFREKLNYVLRNGVVIQLGGFGSQDFYTNKNICDAVAVAYLREHPQDITKFSRYPEDWQERIKQKEVKNESTTTEAKVEQKD
jgi:hypothetical protein